MPHVPFVIVLSLENFFFDVTHPFRFGEMFTYGIVKLPCVRTPNHCNTVAIIFILSPSTLSISNVPSRPRLEFPNSNYPILKSELKQTSIHSSTVDPELSGLQKATDKEGGIWDLSVRTMSLSMSSNLYFLFPSSCFFSRSSVCYIYYI